MRGRNRYVYSTTEWVQPYAVRGNQVPEVNAMVVRVGGSMAYMPGDGVLDFEDSVRTVGELKSAIESALGLPTFKQVTVYTSTVQWSTTRCPLCPHEAIMKRRLAAHPFFA